jgi:SAM-dependent methyltransferase
MGFIPVGRVMYSYLSSLPSKSRNPRRFPADAFSRPADTDDSAFDARRRTDGRLGTDRLDSDALATIREVVGQLVVEESPVLLELTAGGPSPIPETIRPARVVAVGPDEGPLAASPGLSERLVRDLNQDPELPFSDGTFDGAICTISVGDLTRPWQVFQEVGRTLKPGGLLLVVFSSRFSASKSVKIWRECGEEERVLLVADLFEEATAFNQPRVFVSRGKRRSGNGPSAAQAARGDRVYAVYADKRGGPGLRPRVVSERPVVPYPFGEEEIAARKRRVGETLRCPYCDAWLEKWQVPDTPFNEWPSEHQYVCFNDACAYFLGGWPTMASQGNPCSYRFMYDPTTGGCYPFVVLNEKACRGSIVPADAAAAK